MTELEIAEENYFASWRSLVAGATGGVVEETDELLRVAVPLPAAYFNSAFVKPPARVGDHLADAMAFFAGRNTPFTVRYREDDELAASACEARALTSGGAGAPVMFGDAAAIAEGDTADVRIVDEALLPDYLTTMGGGFGVPPQVLGTIFTPDTLKDPTFVALLAYDGGAPVASSALIVTEGCAGVYNVGTPAEFRNRGHGERATRAAVAEGVRRGCTTTTLQASAMGFPIYERMGYRTLTTWRNHTGEAAS
jgi:hypothetical protein